MKFMSKCFQFWSILGLRFLDLECSIYIFEGLIFAQSARKHFKFMTPLTLPSTPRMYQISIIGYVPSDCLTAFLLEEPWGEGHLHSRCPGHEAIYTVGVMEIILGWRVWTSEVPKCHSSSSPTQDPIQGWHIPHVLPASVFPSKSPKASVTFSIFMCRQMKVEQDMLYARMPRVPSLLYIYTHHLQTLSTKEHADGGRKEGESKASTSWRSVCCYRC